jgi:hypothetical protein
VGVVRSSWGRSSIRDPAVLTRICVQADLNRCPRCKVPWAVESPLLGCNDLLGGFEELWISGAGSAEELGIHWRHTQGCVGRSGGLRDPKLPLSLPTGVQLVPTFRKISETSKNSGPRPPESLPIHRPLVIRQEEGALRRVTRKAASICGEILREVLRGARSQYMVHS